jgi:hypothetical protein|tara:strand:+ start:189 stop:398 length:210 start_codon:yes stop_codon:yes gene_type:complete
VVELTKKEYFSMMDRLVLLAALFFCGLTGCTGEPSQEVITKGGNAKETIQVPGTTQDDKVEELLLPGQD